MSSPHATDVIRQGGGQSLTRESWTKRVISISNFVVDRSCSLETSHEITRIKHEQTHLKRYKSDLLGKAFLIRDYLRELAASFLPCLSDLIDRLF
jgi:hypothetical protein